MPRGEKPPNGDSRPKGLPSQPHSPLVDLPASAVLEQMQSELNARLDRGLSELWNCLEARLEGHLHVAEESVALQRGLAGAVAQLQARVLGGNSRRPATTGGRRPSSSGRPSLDGRLPSRGLVRGTESGKGANCGWFAGDLQDGDDPPDAARGVPEEVNCPGSTRQNLLRGLRKQSVGEDAPPSAVCRGAKDLDLPHLALSPRGAAPRPLDTTLASTRPGEMPLPAGVGGGLAAHRREANGGYASDAGAFADDLPSSPLRMAAVASQRTNGMRATVAARTTLSASLPEQPKMNARASTDSQWRTMIRKHMSQRGKRANQCGGKDLLTANARQRRVDGQSRLARFVDSFIFECIAISVTTANVIFVGIQVEGSAINHGDTSDKDTAMVGLQIFFCFFFICELLTRMAAEGRKFFRSTDCGWNMFDLFVVCATIVDTSMIVAALAAGDGQAKMSSFSMLRTFRIMRIIRVVRVIRVIRLISFFRELRMMCTSILSCFTSLLWVLVVLLFMFYIVGVMFVMGAVDHLNTNDMWEDASAQQLIRLFGGLWCAILTLFQSMSNGNSWGDVYEVLGIIGVGYQYVYLLFIFVSTFGVVNIVTGIFVESSLSTASSDREAMVQDQREKTKDYLDGMVEMFHEIDANGSGSISLEEFAGQLHDERALAYFEALRLDISEVETLFTLLDADQSGTIDLEEFVVGCKKLAGESRSLDIAVLQLQMQWLTRSFADFTVFIEEQLGVPPAGRIGVPPPSPPPRLSGISAGCASDTNYDIYATEESV